MPLQSIPAHYDGSHVLLDEPVVIKPNSRLIVTVLEDHDPEREDFLRMTSESLAASYCDEEVEYGEEDLVQ